MDFSSGSESKARIVDVLTLHLDAATLDRKRFFDYGKNPKEPADESRLQPHRCLLHDT